MGQNDADDPNAPPPLDPDRAAILARRQRFVAIALSGLAASCSLPDCGPSPCLDIKAPADSPEGRRDRQREAEARERERQQQLEATPTPCLSPPRPPQPDAKTDAVKTTADTKAADVPK